MDFDSLTRRDLQFFCKKNKIPANMTNIAMADALKALDIVEGIDEFANQSPTSIAKNLPSAARTAARTTRRKATKDETQSSELVTRSCLVTSKSLAREMDQENKNTKMQNLDGTDTMPEANVSKTPATRSTRKAQTAASVQRVYSTRRSVRLLEDSMADLSLKTKETPAKKHEDAGSKFQAKSDDNSEKLEEIEVMSVRDLNDSLEKEWDDSKNDPDLDILYGDLGDISFVDVSTHKEQMNESGTLTRSEDSSMISASTVNTLACYNESKSEDLKIDSKSESESEETDPWEDNEFGDAVDKNQEAFESKANASKVIADEPKELDVDSDEWSDYEIGELELEDNTVSQESTDVASEEAPVSDNKTPSILAAGNETETPLSPSEAEPTLESDKNKENVAEGMVLNNNGETEAEKTTKKIIDEESFKDLSMRKLTKMVKELAIKSKQQQNNKETS